jgi:hypothetical protein
MWIKYYPSVMRIHNRDPVLFYPKDPGSGMIFSGSWILKMTQNKFEVVKLINYKVYSLEKYRKDEKLNFV